MALNVNITVFVGNTPLRLASTVERYELRQAMGELFELEAEVLLTDPALDLATVMGGQALVSFLDQPYLTQLEGIVRSVRQLTSEPTGVSRYELRIVPPLWLTTRRRDHRIFQNRTVIEIVTDVLSQYGGRIDPPTVGAMLGKHPKREYVVQYGETDHDFLFRILAEEGISSYFEHLQGSVSPCTLWTLVDDTTIGQPFAQVPYVPPSSLGFSQPHVFGVLMSSGLETSLVTVRDYDFENPEHLLDSVEATRQVPFENEADLESYAYAQGGLVTERAGATVARQHLEEARSLRRVLTCHSTFDLSVGTRFALTGHPRQDLPSSLLVVRTRTFMDSNSRSPSPTLFHSLECIPAGDVFRPRRSPKPRILGTHLAFVVGQSDGDEIDVDKYGRVKVSFCWDRRDIRAGGPTRHVRVSQPWAGSGFGMVMLPRVNEEVIVSYFDGDPDEPVIIGRLHNAVVTTPLSLPAQKTRSTWRSRSSPGGDGYNEIMMEDLAGQEKLELHAHRDFQSDTGRDSNTTVGADQTVTVKGAQSFSAGSHSTSAGTVDINASTTHTIVAGTRASVGSPTITLNGSTRVEIHGGAVTTVHGEALVAVDGHTVAIHGAGAITLTAPSITVKAGMLSLDGGGMVDVHGGVINLNC